MTDPVSSMTTLSLRDRLDRGEPLLILDVREPSETDFAAIPIPPTALGLSIPMGAIRSRLEALRIAAIDRPTLVVYCHHGVRSMSVARWLATQGLTHLANLEGGIDAWSTLVDSTVRRY